MRPTRKGPKATPDGPDSERREFGTLRLRGRIWWVRYKVNGKPFEESSGSADPRKAEKLLARRQAELGIGAFVAPDVKRTTFEHLAQIIRDDYAVNGRRSAADRLTAYVRQRLEQGAAAATVRNELNALRRAFRLAKRAGKVAQVPDFPSITLHNTRTGFFEEADFRAVLAELPEHLRPVVEFAYLGCTGGQSASGGA